MSSGGGALLATGYFLAAFQAETQARGGHADRVLRCPVADLECGDFSGDERTATTFQFFHHVVQRRTLFIRQTNMVRFPHGIPRGITQSRVTQPPGIASVSSCD